MTAIFHTYLILLGLYLLWNVFSSLLEQEPPVLIDLLLYILYVCVAFGVGKYYLPGLTEQLGAWSAFVSVYLTTGVVLFTLLTLASVFFGGSDEQQTPTQEPLGDGDLDGDEPIPEELALQTGQQIAQLFSPQSSATEKLSALGQLDQAMGDEADDNEDVTLAEKVIMCTGTLLFIPAVFLNFMAQ